MLPRSGLALCTLMSIVLAGCAQSGGEGGAGEDAPELEVTSTTGGIRGVVVDGAVRPVEGADIALQGSPQTTKSDEAGLFSFSGLPAGTYVVLASHPLYDQVQQTVEVEAGVPDPAVVKILLTRLIPEDPFLVTMKFDGFIVCSVNTIGLLSEECGEGAGVPCEDPVTGTPIPPPGCTRVGGQGNNEVQFDVYIDSPSIASIVFEKSWEATSEAGGELYTPIGINWRCDPSCAWDDVTEMNGPSPQYAMINREKIEESGIVPGMNLTMFTWAGSFEDPAGVALNQPYRDFMTFSYYVPLPEGWSFIQGSPNPFE